MNACPMQKRLKTVSAMAMKCCVVNQGILNSLSLVLRDLSQVKDYDTELAQVYSQLSDVENSLQDCGHF